ncbi:WecB/TagA/CpsF family glycosyltransferase [Effusibacillus lacus]|nr:WecB/TagA/CpsF family glycosyltransferase [Effusibacillus lacus]TCS69775.1 N-acetylmannosaminyltransferase [Effusibacillus lacus]
MPKTVDNTFDILGVPFSTLSFAETINLLEDWMGGAVPRQVVTANPEIVMNAREDKEMERILQQADLVTPDGIGIVYAAKILGGPIRERVTGADILPPLFRKADREGWTVYLLGASPESNRLAQANLSRLYANLKLTGRDGFFREEEIPALLSDIRAAAPKLLLVGLGLGKQEKFIAKYLQDLQVPLAIGIGGCIDVYAGTVKRAPVLFRKLNIEWLYRLLKQPSRWRRQLALPKFALTVLLKRFGK